MQSTRTRLAALSATALLLVACGGSDDDAVASPQDELADTALELIDGIAEEEGIEVSNDCVRDIISGLSDEEAAAGLAALNDPDSDSEAFDPIGELIEDECFS